MGSAWRCTTFHSPSSGRKIIVERTAYGMSSSLAPILASARSICTTKASSEVAYFDTTSYPRNSHPCVTMRHARWSWLPPPTHAWVGRRDWPGSRLLYGTIAPSRVRRRLWGTRPKPGGIARSVDRHRPRQPFRDHLHLVLPVRTLCGHPTLFSGVRGRGILRSSP